MRNFAGTAAAGLIGLSSLAFVSCGGGGGGGASVVPTPAPTNSPNVVSVIVDAGPNNSSVNTLFTTVTVCVPGSTTSCQTIDHIQVDTGSNGLRLLSPVLTLSLPVTMASDGNSLLECTQFVGAYSWGPIALADIQVGGETASSVPIQVIGGSTITAPTACSDKGTAEDTVAAFGANGILGVGVFEQDCGTSCAPPNTANTFYYSCSASACGGIAVDLNSQVLNPIRLFATDNDGSIIDLPSVAAPGATTLTGSLIFGIDTQTNNASGSETILGVDLLGDFTTVFNSQTLSQSFLDSGTNGIFFDDANLTPCPPPANSTDPDFSGFYCPASAQALTATLTGTNNTSIPETFTVDNAQTLATNHPTFSVLPTLAGTWSTIANSNTSNTFDWGLPFFYGRRVITAIENQRTAVGSGPYVAF